MSYDLSVLAKSTSEIFLFDGYKLKTRAKENAFVAAVGDLKQDEILRLFTDHNPFDLIRKIVIRYGSKIIFQYLLNHEGVVVIDFKKVG